MNGGGDVITLDVYAAGSFDVLRLGDTLASWSTSERDSCPRRPPKVDVRSEASAAALHRRGRAHLTRVRHYTQLVARRGGFGFVASGPASRSASAGACSCPLTTPVRVRRRGHPRDQSLGPRRCPWLGVGRPRNRARGCRSFDGAPQHQGLAVLAVTRPLGAAQVGDGPGERVGA
jgi:hypothetical protein